MMMMPQQQCGTHVIRGLLVVVVAMLVIPIVQSLNTTTTTISNNITKLPDYSKLNPYEEGCLHSYGIPTRKRTCNSEDGVVTDGDDDDICSPNDMTYMEIRIHTGDWESITYESWILQILLSELLHIPTTIEPGRGVDASINFYNTHADYIFGTHTVYESIETAYSIPDGDCSTIFVPPTSFTTTNKPQRINPNITCAHVVPESWRGTQSSSEVRQLVFEDIIEPPQTLGVLGLETWFITKFTLDEHPQFAIYLGLQGEDNRALLAKTFKRPTTWYEYCTQVSDNNCTIPNNVTHRPPQTDAEQVQYFNEGNYTGHFRFTDDNDCESNPTTCTGHMADFPCSWDSFVQSQLKYLDISLKSSGPEEPIGGYTYSRLIELWRAANATKSDLIMHYWTPEPLVQEFVNTDAEFIRITMPPPSQLCADNRRPEIYQCSANETLRYGNEYGTCEESTKNLYKFIVGNLYDVTYNNPKISEPIRSPAYDAIRLFQLSELQLGQIFDYIHTSSPFMVDSISNGTTIPTSNNNKTTARDAVCRWVVENLDTLHTFVPRTYPRTLRSSMTTNTGSTTSSSDSSSGSNSSNSNVLSIITIILGCIATLLVLVMWYMVYKNRTLKSIKFAQIEFLYLLLAGLLLVGIGSIMVGLQPSNTTCITIIWFINFGYTLEFVPLIVKVAAVNKLIGSARRYRRVVLSRNSLFTTVFAISALILLFLLIWTIVDPPVKNDNFVLTNTVNYDGNTIVDVSHYCASDSGMWDYMAVGWNTLLLLCATVLAFQTRTLQKDFNESQTLAFLIYSHFFFVVLRLITVILQQGNGTTSNVEKIVGLRSITFSIDTIATILIYFAPKFTKAANKRDNGASSSATASMSLRNGGGSVYFRSEHFSQEDRPMTGSATEANRTAHVESAHSATSTETKKRSNRFSFRKDKYEYNNKNSEHPVSESNLSHFSSAQSDDFRPMSQHEYNKKDSEHPVSDRNVSHLSSAQSDDLRPMSQHDEVADGEDDNDGNDDVVVRLDSASATADLKINDTSTFTTATNSTTATDDGTKCTATLNDDIDEENVIDIDRSNSPTPTAAATSTTSAADEINEFSTTVAGIIDQESSDLNISTSVHDTL